MEPRDMPYQSSTNRLDVLTRRLERRLKMDKRIYINKIDPRFFSDKELTEEQILEWFNLCDAVWLHDGDVKKPHAELTSGKCSNGFFDCLRVLKYPRLNKLLAFHLVKKLKANGIEKPDWVIGSPYAAITFSAYVADFFDAIHAFPEKDPEAPKRMVWRRIEIPQGARILQIEELITTSGTFQKVHRAIEEGNPYPVDFLPQVGVLVHRPPKLPADYGDRKVVALVEKEIWAVDPPCDLCKAGSSCLRPKTHWKELTEKQKKEETI